MRHTLAAGTIAGFLALATPAFAQTTGATPDFRPGHWAAELGVGTGQSAELLHFSTATRAWLAGVDFTLGRTTVENGGGVGGPDENTQTTGSLGGRLGLRRYGGTPGEVRPLLGAGVTGTFARNASGPAVNRVYQAGLYGEVGAVYLVTPRLGVGASGEVRALYENQRFANDDAVLSKSHGVALRGSVARLLASVYF